MIDNSYLKELLSNLRKYGIKKIKMQGLELEFHVEQKTPEISSDGSHHHLSEEHDDNLEKIAETIKKQEESLPPDLRADALMDQDKILNWSSPDQKPFEEEPEMPLTGEMPL